MTRTISQPTLSRRQLLQRPIIFNFQVTTYFHKVLKVVDVLKMVIVLNL